MKLTIGHPRRCGTLSSMRWHAFAGAALLASACGRFEFSPITRDDSGGTGDDGSGPDPDATGDATSAACSAGFICDGFEGATIDPVWTVFGDVTPDTTIARRGTSSLKMNLPATAANTQVVSFITHTGPNITNATSLWMRAWFRMSLLPASTNALEILAVVQTGNQGDYIFIRAANTELYHQFNTDGAGSGQAPPINTWFCLNWNLTLATTTTGSSFVTSDVIPAFQLTNSVTQGTPVLDRLSIGPYYSANNNDVGTAAFDMWVDDVIVSASPTTCAD